MLALAGVEWADSSWVNDVKKPLNQAFVSVAI